MAGVMRPRWEGDERGYGNRDGRAFAGGVEALKNAMLVEGWVAEDPDTHLLPQILAHFEGSPGPLRLRRSDVIDDSLVVELEAPAELRPAEIRRAVFGVVGSIAETATFVREIHPDAAADMRIFELSTGSHDGDSPFAGHGHTVKFLVTRSGDEGADGDQVGRVLYPLSNELGVTVPG